MSRSYASRRRSETMRAYRPVETPATEACTIYRQKWVRLDGGSTRLINVLALDDDMAIAMGELRLLRLGESPTSWRCDSNAPGDKLSSMVTAILSTEDPAEQLLREWVFGERCANDDPGGERLAS